MGIHTLRPCRPFSFCAGGVEALCRCPSASFTIDSVRRVLLSNDFKRKTSLTKTQLVRHLAEKVEIPNKTAVAFLEQLADLAVKETKKSGVFVVPGLGRLVKAHRKARMGRNLQTGEPIQIKAKTVVKFRVAKAAKDAIAPKK